MDVMRADIVDADLDRLLQDRWPGKARRRSARLEIDRWWSILEIVHQRTIVEDLGASGYEVREDILGLPTASSSTAKLVKEGPSS